MRNNLKQKQGRRSSVCGSDLPCLKHQDSGERGSTGYFSSCSTILTRYVSLKTSTHTQIMSANLSFSSSTYVHLTILSQNYHILSWSHTHIQTKKKSSAKENLVRKEARLKIRENKYPFSVVHITSREQVCCCLSVKRGGTIDFKIEYFPWVTHFWSLGHSNRSLFIVDDGSWTHRHV